MKFNSKMKTMNLNENPYVYYSFLTVAILVFYFLTRYVFVNKKTVEGFTVGDSWHNFLMFFYNFWYSIYNFWKDVILYWFNIIEYWFQQWQIFINNTTNNINNTIK